MRVKQSLRYAVNIFSMSTISRYFEFTGMFYNMFTFVSHKFFVRINYNSSHKNIENLILYQIYAFFSSHVIKN